MATSKPIDIPFPLSSRPGPPTMMTFPLQGGDIAIPQGSNPESSGRLVNCYAEPLGDPQSTGRGEPTPQVWRRSPGLTQWNLTATGQTIYRGGLQVGTISYEIFTGNSSTVDGSGNYVSLGSFPGALPVSIARNLNTPPDVVAVDIANGAWALTTAGVPSAPVSYNGGGVLPVPNSVAGQDGYLFFTTATNLVYATAINSLTMNALTNVKIQGRPGGQLLRAIAYQGNMLFFTTASCEIWADAANPAPTFPYSRQLILETGLLQPNAIAGFDDGFAELFWIAQDFGVYWMTPGSLQPIKISNPDMERLIQWHARDGHNMYCSCYMFAGKKMFVVQHLSAPQDPDDWTWEFNLTTKKWNERTSLFPALGSQSKWRGVGGHPAFGRWLMGDAQSGNILAIDDVNFSDVVLGLGTVPAPYVAYPMLMRLESGLCGMFPNRIVARRADFQFVTGVGNPLTVPNPQIAISWSDDNGRTWKNPLLRNLGQIYLSKFASTKVTNTGQTGKDGRRWRVDCSDPVYTAMLKATMSSNPREY